MWKKVTFAAVLVSLLGVQFGKRINQNLTTNRRLWNILL